MTSSWHIVEELRQCLHGAQDYSVLTGGPDRPRPGSMVTTRSARGLRGGRAAGFTRREAGFDIGRTNWHFVLSVVEKPSS